MNYNEYRRKSKKVKVGGLYIGGDAPIPVQSMTNVSSSDYDALYTQIKALENSGCDIVRMTVPDDESVRTLYRIKCSDVRKKTIIKIKVNYYFKKVLELFF